MEQNFGTSILVACVAHVGHLLDSEGGGGGGGRRLVEVRRGLQCFSIMYTILKEKIESLLV